MVRSLLPSYCHETQRIREEAKAEAYGVSGNVVQAFESLRIAQDRFDSSTREGKVEALGK